MPWVTWSRMQRLKIIYWKYVINFPIYKLVIVISNSGYMFHKKLNKILQDLAYLFVSFWNFLKITIFYLVLFVFIRFITHCHSLSLIALFGYSLSFVVTHYHSLPLVVPLVVTRLPLFVTRCHLLYHSL